LKWPQKSFVCGGTFGSTSDIDACNDFRLHRLGAAQHVDGATQTGLGRLHQIASMMCGKSGTGRL
jgi:hypothetical protein